MPKYEILQSYRKPVTLKELNFKKEKTIKFPSNSVQIKTIKLLESFSEKNKFRNMVHGIEIKQPFSVSLLEKISNC